MVQIEQIPTLVPLQKCAEFRRDQLFRREGRDLCRSAEPRVVDAVVNQDRSIESFDLRCVDLDFEADIDLGIVLGGDAET